MVSQRSRDIETEWQGKQPASGYREQRDPSLPSGHDRIRGQVDVPLSRDGQKQVFMLGVKMRRKGGFDKLYHAGSKRTRDTANAVAHSRKDQKDVPMEEKKDLLAMGYGKYEGMHTEEAEPEIRHYITDKPDTKLPGGGESFNGFKHRVLSAIDRHIAEHKKNPQKKIGLVVNGRTIKTKEGHLAAGSPKDHSVDKKVALAKEKPDEKPGGVSRIDYENNRLEHIDPNSKEPLKPGVYMIRHGKTNWNKGESSGGS